MSDDYEYEDYGTSESEGRQATRDPAYWDAADEWTDEVAAVWQDLVDEIDSGEYRRIAMAERAETEGDWLERQDARGEERGDG